ncbi:hypothetical protein B0H14DRAFT_3447085 [Mycena olivaceomarginata]|nr:hypothetical protein B0H14DRAFT_3447085 [Mycena olivaceomarginata]
MPRSVATEKLTPYPVTQVKVRLVLAPPRNGFGRHAIPNSTTRTVGLHQGTPQREKSPDGDQRRRGVAIARCRVHVVLSVSSSTTTTSKLRCLSPYLGRPLHHLSSSPLEPQHPEAPRASKYDAEGDGIHPRRSLRTRRRSRLRCHNDLAHRYHRGSFPAGYRGIDASRASRASPFSLTALSTTPYVRFLQLETERDKEREIEFDPPPTSLSPILLLAESGFGFQTLAHTTPTLTNVHDQDETSLRPQVPVQNAMLGFQPAYFWLLACVYASKVLQNRRADQHRPDTLIYAYDSCPVRADSETQAGTSRSHLSDNPFAAVYVAATSLAVATWQRRP